MLSTGKPAARERPCRGRNLAQDVAHGDSRAAAAAEAGAGVVTAAEALRAAAAPFSAAPGKAITHAPRIDAHGDRAKRGELPVNA
jgi:hypothetical protein